MADFDIKDFTTQVAAKVKGVVIGGKIYPGKVTYDELGAEVLGRTTDAKSTATDGTAASAVSIWKQISASVQALASGISIAAAQTIATVTTVTTVTTVAAVTAITNALPAGTNLLGKVKTKFIIATGTALTRVADTNAYAASDSISNTVTAGSVTSNSITVSDVNDDTFTIERMRIACSDTGFGGKSCRVWLYNSDQTGANSQVQAGDNAAFSNKKAGFIGTLSGTFRAMQDGAAGVFVPDEGARIVTAPTTGAKTIYWQLQALEAITPASGATFTPTLEGFQGAA